MYKRNIEEGRGEQIYRLLRSLNDFKNALTIEETDARSEEVLRNVKSLVQEIEASYDLLYEPQIQDFRNLHKTIIPILAQASYYESVMPVLKCIERAERSLREFSKEYSLSRETMSLFERFKDSINSLARKSLDEVTSYLQSVDLYSRVSLLENSIIGDQLERYYIPKLVEREGYTTKPRIVHTSAGDVQVDVRAEKDDSIGFENLERLRGKNVIIVEVKTTLKREDISEFSKKSKAIKEIYQKDSELWNYKLRFETWLVACYGWDDYLKSYATREEIIPIDKGELEARLEKRNLLDKSRPPCPKQ